MIAIRERMRRTSLVKSSAATGIQGCHYSFTPKGLKTLVNIIKNNILILPLLDLAVSLSFSYTHLFSINQHLFLLFFFGPFIYSQVLYIHTHIHTYIIDAASYKSYKLSMRLYHGKLSPTF